MDRTDTRHFVEMPERLEDRFSTKLIVLFAQVIPEDLPDDLSLPQRVADFILLLHNAAKKIHPKGSQFYARWLR